MTGFERVSTNGADTSVRMQKVPPSRSIQNKFNSIHEDQGPKDNFADFGKEILHQQDDEGNESNQQMRTENNFSMINCEESSNTVMAGEQAVINEESDDDEQLSKVIN